MLSRLVLLVVLSVFAGRAAAQAVEQPTGEPLLTISGSISQGGEAGSADFDRDMLEALGSVSVSTKTPWHEGTTLFEGPTLQSIMEKVGASGSEVTVVALNDYVTTIPLSDFARHKPILALKKNGKYMSVRELGPLFIIYPYDSDPDLRTQTIFSRSAWQVRRMIIK